MKFKVTVNEADSRETLGQILTFVRESLASKKLETKEKNRAEILCEESLLSLMEHADFTKRKVIRVSIRKFFGDVIIELAVPGKEFDFAESINVPDVPDDEDDIAPDAEAAIRNLILSSYSHIIKYKHYQMYNVIRIKAFVSAYSMLYKTLGALLSAVIFGLAAEHIFSEDTIAYLNDNVLMLVQNIFLNSMKMCTIPVVFFSVMPSVADIGDVSGFRRSVGKLLACFLSIQVLAVALGFGLVMLFGTGKGAYVTPASPADIQGASFSMTDMLRNIIPENIVSPFLNSNTLQLIVLGVIVGIAASAKDAKLIRSSIRELNDVFMKIAEFFMKFIPIVVFCSVGSIVLTEDIRTLASLAGIFFTVILGFILLNAFYLFMIKSAAKLNPLRMFKKAVPAMITAFGTCSATSAIPDSMKAADDMGLLQKFSSFAVSIGASLNKNAFCLSLSVIVMSAANMYGIRLTWLQIISLGLSVIIIAPGTSWAPVIALSTLFAQAGCPVKSIGMIMSIYTLLDMADTVTCCNGTLASTLIVAKSGGMIDEEEYNRQ
ncbi:MAG: dicarboxylate/amino acid:cation symporter [Synergistaceae bacterium]|nr:dicarboxylate/amino acid:cation symporter [Synergistaceae bacterium]